MSEIDARERGSIGRKYRSYIQTVVIRNTPLALSSRTLSVDLSTSRSERRLGRFHLRAKS